MSRLARASFLTVFACFGLFFSAAVYRAGCDADHNARYLGTDPYAGTKMMLGIALGAIFVVLILAGRAMRRAELKRRAPLVLGDPQPAEPEADQLRQ